MTRNKVVLTAECLSGVQYLEGWSWENLPPVHIDMESIVDGTITQLRRAWERACQGAPKFQGIFFIPPLLEPCKTVPYLNLREITKNLLMSSEIKGFHANYVKCLSILQL